MKPLRVGVIGVGHLGRHHARILAGLDNVELVGVADSRAEQAQKIAEPLGTTPYTDYQALLDLVDAVSIAAPTTLHHEIASAALDRGLPCLVEKPLAASSDEASDLVDRAARMGTPLQVGHIERFNPALEQFNTLGFTPKYIAAERLATFTFRSSDVGVVFDLMIHDLDVLLSLVQAPVRTISAVGVSLFGENEDVANARIEFSNGTVATITASRASMQATRKMRVWAPEGYAALDFGGRQVSVVRPSAALREGRLELEGLDLTQPAAIKEHVFGTMLRVEQLKAPEAGPDQLTSELAHFVNAIRTGQRPRVTGEDGLRSIGLAEAILASLRQHQWEGTSAGPVGPQAVRPASGSASYLPEPKFLRHRDRIRARDQLVERPGEEA